VWSRDLSATVTQVKLTTTKSSQDTNTMCGSHARQYVTKYHAMIMNIRSYRFHPSLIFTVAVVTYIPPCIASAKRALLAVMADCYR